MKKTISICLEEDILRKIDIYKNENGITSRSVVAERAFIEFLKNHLLNNNGSNLNLRKMVEEIIKGMNLSINDNKINEIKEEVAMEENNEMDNIVNSEIDHMLD